MQTRATENQENTIRRTSDAEVNRRRETSATLIIPCSMIVAVLLASCAADETEQEGLGMMRAALDI